MQNKDIINTTPHSRPCFFAFKDTKIADINRVVPVSSGFGKFRRIEQDKINKYGHCHTIRSGTVPGRNTAFLIQNMYPATRKYLTAYIDKNDCPIRIDGRIATDTEKNSRHILAMANTWRKGYFP